MILAFPCNQFFGQESGPQAEIKKFVADNFGASFPIFQKIEVNGPNTHPLYIYLRNQSELFDAKKNQAKVIPWNFAKFILDRNGKVIKFAPPNVEPNELRGIIQEQLSK